MCFASSAGRPDGAGAERATAAAKRATVNFGICVGDANCVGDWLRLCARLPPRCAVRSAEAGPAGPPPPRMVLSILGVPHPGEHHFIDFYDGAESFYDLRDRHGARYPRSDDVHHAGSTLPLPTVRPVAFPAAQCYCMSVPWRGDRSRHSTQWPGAFGDHIHRVCHIPLRQYATLPLLLLPTHATSSTSTQRGWTDTSTPSARPRLVRSFVGLRWRGRAGASTPRLVDRTHVCTRRDRGSRRLPTPCPRVHRGADLAAGLPRPRPRRGTLSSVCCDDDPMARDEVRVYAASASDEGTGLSMQLLSSRFASRRDRVSGSYLCCTTVVLSINPLGGQ